MMLCWYRSDFEKHSSFVTGKYPIRMDAPDDTRRRVRFGILPIVRYTGHAELLPLAVRCVLSDARMTGVIVAPGGKCF